MRRGLTAAAATIAGTGLLIVAKLGPAQDGLAATGGTATEVPAIEGSATAAPATAPSKGASPVPRPSLRPTASASAKPAKSAKAPPPPAGGLHDGTYAGPPVSERYGSIKVTIVVSGGRIDDVAASCSCSGRSRSISDDAFATLEPRVLSAQSADVDSVSGATYTYEAYKRSLAAAISSAKA